MRTLKFGHILTKIYIFTVQKNNVRACDFDLQINTIDPHLWVDYRTGGRRYEQFTQFAINDRTTNSQQRIQIIFTEDSAINAIDDNSSSFSHTHRDATPFKYQSNNNSSWLDFPHLVSAVSVSVILDSCNKQPSTKKRALENLAPHNSARLFNEIPKFVNDMRVRISHRTKNLKKPD